MISALPSLARTQAVFQQPAKRLLRERCARTGLLGSWCALLVIAFAPVAVAMEPVDATALLIEADEIRSFNHREFVTRLERLQRESADLSAEQQHYLRYLQGWRSAYEGNYDAAIAVLEPVSRDAADETVRFRAATTVANVLVLSRQYDAAFLQLNRILALLPEITDRRALDQGFAVTASLYNQVGEYELGLAYADRLMHEGADGTGVCRGGRVRLEALYKRGKLPAAMAEAQSTINACAGQSDWLNANLARTYIARLHMDQKRYAEAVHLLQSHHDEVRRTGYRRLIAEFDALLASAYYETGKAEQTRQAAQSAIESGVHNQFTEPLVTAYRLLYLLAKERGDAREALAYHEKYAAADKGYLDDVSARQLAYQRVSHDAVANKLEIESLNKRNEVLQLQQALGKKAAETSRLYITLLILVLGFILLFAYRIKRSQLHFMRLSQVDGLTGIANRPHFIAQAGRVLDAGRKEQQEVCAVLCDLDHFKSINDKYGHATGDFVLKQTVAACKAHLRETDLFGRFGGEEFCILLPGCSLQDARERCEQLRSAIAAIATHPGSMVASVSASFGIAATHASGYELRQLLAHADAALYRAKHAGRNCVMIYDETNHDQGDTQPPAHSRVRGAARG